ncbi:MAG: branched-chain amino acid aminotransferase [Bacillota bacterium]|nr:branched-chain amino acid aminotransferase [Bacillota bacterium]
MDIKITRTSNPQKKPDSKNLGFGRYFTDHMFVMDYTDGRGWHDARIVPYSNMSFDPATMVFHYAQESFEGLKAYHADDGRILLFRPEKNAERLNRTHDRLCMPELPVEDFIQAVKAVVSVDRDWIPTEPGTSLYIRPFAIATDIAIGVHPSHTYKFIIILSPVGAYYPEGMNPVKIYVEDEYVRAVKGGTGFAKCGGNYAASVKSQDKANAKGYTQVLWLDGVHRKYIEEVGTMNVFFKINGEVLTAPIEGSILPGVTRDSCIQLLKKWGVPVSERRFTIDELMEAARAGKLEEAFGSGTAAVISPIGELNFEGEIATINGFKIGELTQKLYDTLTAIQWGKAKDDLGWTTEI